MKAFQQGNVPFDLATFCGVDSDRLDEAASDGTLQEDLVMFRLERRQKRDAAIQTAGPATSATRNAAEWVPSSRIVRADF